MLPHIVGFLLLVDKRFYMDLKRYAYLNNASFRIKVYEFIYLFVRHKTLRNVFYYRMGWVGRLIQYIPGVSSCHIKTRNVGGGIFIEHGDCCWISAKEIGENCWINQGVTIGYSNKTDAPEIGNNVAVKAGAKVFGKIRIGDNVIIGANAVVNKNVPDNCTVVGVPAYIVKCNGKRVRIDL